MEYLRNHADWECFGIFGLFQPIAGWVAVKEVVLPSSANVVIFLAFEQAWKEQRDLLVCEAVGELLEELVAGEICHNHPLAHGQGLCSGCGNHVAGRGVHENPVLIN